jgi:hypothetical protein
MLCRDRPSGARTTRWGYEGIGVGDRFAQQVDQRVVDARVLDAGGSEKKVQDASRVDVSKGDSGGLRKSPRHRAVVSLTAF